MVPTLRVLGGQTQDHPAQRWGGAGTPGPSAFGGPSGTVALSDRATGAGAAPPPPAGTVLALRQALIAVLAPIQQPNCSSLCVRDLKAARGGAAALGRTVEVARSCPPGGTVRCGGWRRVGAELAIHGGDLRHR